MNSMEIRETAFKPQVVEFTKKLSAREQHVRDDTVRVLEGYLKKAQRGELLGVFIVAANKENGGFHVWSETDNYPQLLGSISLGLHSYLSHGQCNCTEADPDIDGPDNDPPPSDTAS